MSPARLRMLSEPQVRRVLSAGGMLVESGGAWRAYRSHDARHSPAGGVSPLIAGRLRTEGAVSGHPQKPGRFLASALQAIPHEVVPPPSGLLEGRISQKPRSLFELIVAGLASNPGELARLKAATGRFLADMGQVSRRPPPKRKLYAARRFQRARCRPRAAQQIGSRHRARQVPSSGKPSGPFGHSGHVRAR